MVHLRNKAMAAVCAAGLGLGAFGGVPAARADTKTEAVKFALDWTPNTNHVGIYVARALGYFKDAGLDVTILPYTDTAPAMLIANGAADFGIGDIGLYSQRAAGAPIEAVYAVTQAETGRVIVKADRSDIKSPKDLDGKTYGGFGSDWENTLMRAVIRDDGGTGDFKSVILGTSAYQALDSGRVDFTMDMSTWEGVEAELDGEKVKAFMPEDYGIPEGYTTLILAGDAYLKAHPATAKAFLAAVEKGYAYAVAHPDAAADMLIKAAPEMLTNHQLVHASMQKLVAGHFLEAADGTIGRMDPARMTAVGDFLYKAGMLKDEDGKALTAKPDFASYYSDAYLP